MNKDNRYKNIGSYSTDGFMPSAKRLNTRAVRREPSARPTGSAPGKVRSLNEFSRSLDGFKSSSQSVISSDGFNHRSADISVRVRSRGQAPRVSRATQANDLPVDSSRKSAPDKRGSGSATPKFISRKNKFGLSRRRKLSRRIAVVVGSLILLLGAGFFVRGIVLGNSIFKGGGNSAVLNSHDIDPSTLRGEGDGRVNVMVLGKGGAEQLDGPDLTDTIIVASIDPIAKEAALLSIPRDFWVKSPAGSQSKINQVYYDAKQRSLNSVSSSQRESDQAKSASEQAGVEAVKQVVADTIGIPIHYYAMIDFAGFKKAIDTVGGIDINVTEEMAVQEQMWINGRYYLDVEVGDQHFDGMRALAFSRSRKTSARGDYARSDRQRSVIIGLKDKVLTTDTLANPMRLNQLMNDFSGQLSTDFSVNEMLRLYDLAKGISSDNIASVSLEEYIAGDTINGLSVQVPKLGLFDYADIQGFVRNALRDSFLKKEDAKITVLNGTNTAGLATKRGKELESFGYNVISIDDAPTKDYKDTTIIDLKGGVNKYTRSYLEKRLGVNSVNNLPDSSISHVDSDFVIILGENETSR